MKSLGGGLTRKTGRTHIHRNTSRPKKLLKSSYYALSSATITVANTSIVASAYQILIPLSPNPLTNPVLTLLLILQFLHTLSYDHRALRKTTCLFSSDSHGKSRRSTIFQTFPLFQTFHSYKAHLKIVLSSIT